MHISLYQREGLKKVNWKKNIRVFVNYNIFFLSFRIYKSFFFKLCRFELIFFSQQQLNDVVVWKVIDDFHVYMSNKKNHIFNERTTFKKKSNFRNLNPKKNKYLNWIETQPQIIWKKKKEIITNREDDELICNQKKM